MRWTPIQIRWQACITVDAATVRACRSAMPFFEKHGLETFEEAGPEHDPIGRAWSKDLMSDCALEATLTTYAGAEVRGSRPEYQDLQRRDSASRVALTRSTSEIQMLRSAQAPTVVRDALDTRCP